MWAVRADENDSYDTGRKNSCRFAQWRNSVSHGITGADTSICIASLRMRATNKSATWKTAAPCIETADITSEVLCVRSQTWDGSAADRHAKTKLTLNYQLASVLSCHHVVQLWHMRQRYECLLSPALPLHSSRLQNILRSMCVASPSEHSCASKIPSWRQTLLS